MKVKSRLASVLIASMLISSPVQAAGIPTIDVANIVQTTVSAFENIEQVANQVEMIRNQIDQFNKLQEQLDQQVAQFESITGNYNMGALLNDPAFRNARRHIPTSWQETLDLIDGALAAAHQREVQQAARDARVAGERFAANEVYEDDTWAEAVEYIREANAVFTHIGVGQAQYANQTQKVEDIEDMIAEIDTANDLKAAIDLQNRILAEQALLHTELIKVMSAQQINMSEQRLNDHNRRASDRRMADGWVPEIPAI